MNHHEVISLFKSGKRFEETQYPDLGTTSLFRPIRRTGKHTSRFTIDGNKVHHVTGRKVMKEIQQLTSQFDIVRERQRRGLCHVNVFYIKPNNNYV